MRSSRSLLVRSLLSIGLLAVLLPARVEAVIGVPDPVPAATLLFPYFEVDLTNPNGQSTLLAVSNTSATAVLANVVIWSDYGIPVLGFQVYLTGYDTQAIDLRQLLVDGVLPRTASAGQDPTDTISHKGPLSQDINFASCTGTLPPTNLTAGQIADLQKALQGQLVAGFGGCVSRNYGDQIARGYVTMDTLNACTGGFPSTPGYFTSLTTNQNVLTGDWTFVHSAQNFSHGELAVHVEASASDPLTTTPGSYTFYGRFVAGNASDNREPLPTTWGVPSLNRFASGATAGSYLAVWRDPGKPVSPFTCGGAPPSPFPMAVGQALSFDSQSTGTAVTASTLRTAAQLVELGDAVAFPMTSKAGWLYLNLNATTAGGLYGAIKQSWVVAIHHEGGRYAGGFSPVALGHAATSSNVVLPLIP